MEGIGLAEIGIAEEFACGSRGKGALDEPGGGRNGDNDQDIMRIGEHKAQRSRDESLAAADEGAERCPSGKRKTPTAPCF